VTLVGQLEHLARVEQVWIATLAPVGEVFDMVDDEEDDGD